MTRKALITAVALLLAVTINAQYKAGYSVPMKESFDNEICESSQLIRGPEDEILLVNDQICMEELLKGAGE